MSHKTAVLALRGNLLHHQYQRLDRTEIPFQNGPSEKQGVVASRHSEGTFRTATDSTRAINNGTRINRDEDPWSSADLEFTARERAGRESTTKQNGHVALASTPSVI